MTAEVVYAIGEPGKTVVKIGHTQNLRQRLSTIQTGRPERVTVRWSIESASWLEYSLHREFSTCRLGGEWFDFRDRDPVAIIGEAAARLLKAGPPQPRPAPAREVNMTDEEWITPTEAARRVVALGYAETMTRQRIYQLADTDPAWPARRDTWRNVGNYKLLPWHEVEQYFKARDARSGPKGWGK